MFNLDVYNGRLLPQLCESQSLTPDVVNRDIAFMTSILTEADNSGSWVDTVKRILKIVIERVKSFFAWMKKRIRFIIDRTRGVKTPTAGVEDIDTNHTVSVGTNYITAPSSIIHPKISPLSYPDVIENISSQNIDIILYQRHPEYLKQYVPGGFKTVPPSQQIRKAVTVKLFGINDDVDPSIAQIISINYGQMTHLRLDSLAIDDINTQIDEHIDAIEQLERSTIPDIIQKLETEQRDLLDLDARAEQFKAKAGDINKKLPDVGKIVMDSMLNHVDIIKNVYTPYYILSLNEVLYSTSKLVNLFGGVLSILQQIKMAHPQG